MGGLQRVQIAFPLPGDIATDGVAVTGQTLEAGGVTQIGWLSSIRKAITDRLPAALVDGRLSVTATISGTATVTETRPTSTVTVADYTTISDTTRELTLLAANASRRGATVFNATDRPIVLKEGSGASEVSFTTVVPSRGDYALDYPACTGVLSAYLPTIPDGRILVTERA